MPRELTDKDTSYLATLVNRNLQKLRRKQREGKSNPELDTKPLNEPMTNAEKQRRYRLRKKAVRMARDLNLIFLAGIYPRLAGDEIKSGNELLDRMSNLLGEIPLNSELDEDEKWAVLKGNPPGEPATTYDTSRKPKTTEEKIQLLARNKF